MKATVTDALLREWRPIIERGSANELLGILIDACDGSLPGDMLGLEDLAQMERRGDIHSPAYWGLRGKCVTRLISEITGDERYYLKLLKREG